MELIASASTVLFDLSIQHVSTQKYRKPSCLSDLAIASLVLARAIRQVSEGDFLSIRAPCVQQYRIVGNVIDNILDKSELVVVVAFQRTHFSAWIRELKGKRFIGEVYVAEWGYCCRVRKGVGWKAID
jgi:hypothetical protein